MKHALIAATALFAFAAPAAADTVVVSGDTTGAPTYNRALTTTTLSAVGTDNPYEVTTFTVDTTGTYTLALNSDVFDTFLSLYSPSFDPSNALANILAVDDDGGPDFNSLISFTLTSGTTYLAVATGFAPEDFGAYTLTLDGPGDITLGGGGGLVPEPATWAMMIGGFGLAGGALRRRKATVSVTYA